MFRLIKYSMGTVLVAAAAVVGLGGLNLYTYHRFTDEAPVATLQFEQLGLQRYRATVTPEGAPSRQFDLAGDEWQLDVRMIKWTDWLTFLGEGPLYRLDRISGRYIKIADGQGRAPMMHDLAAGSGLDVWAFAREAGEWLLPGIDAAYGSSVFLAMGDGFAYEVSISRTGLLARRMASGGGIEQDRQV